MSNSMSKQSSPLPTVAKPWIWLTIAALVMVVGLVVEPERVLSALLTAGVYGVQLTVGALLWIALLTVSGATWWFPVRRDFLAVAEQLVVPALLAAGTAVLGAGVLYSWAAPGAAEHSQLLHEKVAWLNRPFFSLRAVVVVLIWLTLVAVVGKALRKWMSGTAKSKTNVARLSALTLVLVAVTISVAFWDWTMSLEPEWFSTMYGVYGFSGALQGGIAVVAVVAIDRARRDGDERVTAKVRHDFGRLLFGFCFFWAYIWFCQFMLIWYANLPEEVTHYLTRMSPAWGALFWLNVVLNFAVPFLVLLPAGSKRHEGWLFQISLLVIIVRLLDVYLLVEPSLQQAPGVPIYHVAAAALMVVGTISFAQRRSRRKPLVKPATKASKRLVPS